MTINDPLIATRTAGVETLIALGDKAFAGLQKLSELNLQTSRTLLGEAQDTAAAAFAVKDAQEFIAFQSSLLQPAVEKLVAYNRHVYDILVATGTDLGKAAEASMGETHKAMLATMEAAAKSAPVGSEQALAMVKSAFETAGSAYEGLNKAAKQAGEAATATLENAGDTAVKATQAAVGKGKRAEA